MEACVCDLQGVIDALQFVIWVLGITFLFAVLSLLMS